MDRFVLSLEEHSESVCEWLGSNWHRVKGTFALLQTIDLRLGKAAKQATKRPNARYARLYLVGTRELEWRDNTEKRHRTAIVVTLSVFRSRNTIQALDVYGPIFCSWSMCAETGCGSE